MKARIYICTIVLAAGMMTAPAQETKTDTQTSAATSTPNTNEVAVVVKRGMNTTTPKVAVLINRQGMPTGEPILRDTSQAEFRIQASVPQREVKVNHKLDRLLTLTKPAISDKPW